MADAGYEIEYVLDAEGAMLDGLRLFADIPTTCGVVTGIGDGGAVEELMCP